MGNLERTARGGRDAMTRTVTLTIEIDKRHGGPYDRGGADAFNQRRFDPHYFVEDTFGSPVIGVEDMTPEDILQYTLGYLDTHAAFSE